MASILKSKSGTSVIFVDDRGFSYSLPIKIINWFLNTENPEPFLMTMLNRRFEVSRFKPSPIFVSGRSMTLKEALDLGYLDKSFYDTCLWGRDAYSASKKKNKDKKEAEVVKPKVMDVRL